jgi:hypothetical protein
MGEIASICRLGKWMSTSLKGPSLVYRYLVFSCLLTAAPAGATIIWGNTADSEVYSGGVFSYDLGSNGGQIGVNGGFDYSDVYVFQLPTLAAGQQIASADFTFYDAASGSIYNTDLYGLGFRTSPTVLATDWYSGPNDTHNTRLESGIISPSFTFSGLLTTSSTADVALVTYLNSQYSAGAVGGDFVFLRLSSNVSGGTNLYVNSVDNADLAYTLNNAYPGTLSYWQGLYSPRMDVTFTAASSPTPEPGTVAEALIGLGLLIGARCWKLSSKE